MSLEHAFRSLKIAVVLGVLSASLVQTTPAATLNLPERPAGAPSGSAVLSRVAPLPLAEREEILLHEILSGNVPSFLRRLCPVTLTNTAFAGTNSLVIFVTPDYLAVGSDDDCCLMPLSPRTAQRIADATSCLLPTCRMVDAIYQSAPLKLPPSPIPPSSQMTSIPVFSNHNAIVREQRLASQTTYPPGTLVAGHKKDVVLTEELLSHAGKVAIYGWHQTNGVPIQPLYLGHTDQWVDYSQCVRLVSQEALFNGSPRPLAEILTDPHLAVSVSQEGPLSCLKYPASAPANPPPPEWQKPNRFAESTCDLRMEPGVRIHLNAPSARLTNPSQPVTLLFYALPNGNTIEQTIGKKTDPTDDWHFNIQHIAAQVRFVRHAITNRTLIVAYLENHLKSWPAWRRKHGDAKIPEIFGSVKRLFPGPELEVVLASHSGGGSLLFGYLNTVQRVPPEVSRIIFLDSNYAYDSKLGHADKLAEWLRLTSGAQLSVFAYHDSVALLNGTNFVSAAGGTWGRSQAMLEDLQASFDFHSRTNHDLRVCSALDGRIRFFLMENPEKKILHTVQVERNGLIHALLLGTPFENSGYAYFGPRAYTPWIAD